MSLGCWLPYRIQDFVVPTSVSIWTGARLPPTFSTRAPTAARKAMSRSWPIGKMFAVCRFQNNRLRDIKVFPIDQGFGRPRPSAAGANRTASEGRAVYHFRRALASLLVRIFGNCDKTNSRVICSQQLFVRSLQLTGDGSRCIRP